MAKFWRKDQIEHQKNYFALERIEKKGNFTEFVVRTYYCIYKACSLNDGNCCSKYDVAPRKIKYIIYDGIYQEPDHDYNNVIDDCLEKLRLMNYIKYLKNEENGKWFIYLNKPLDFLLDGEHQQYLFKYEITRPVNFLSDNIESSTI